MLRFCPWVFSAIQGANRINRTDGLVVRREFQERADVGQFAARPAIYAPACAFFGDGQYGSKGPSCFGKPGIFIMHVLPHKENDISPVGKK